MRKQRLGNSFPLTRCQVSCRAIVELAFKPAPKRLRSHLVRAPSRSDPSMPWLGSASSCASSGALLSSSCFFLLLMASSPPLHVLPVLQNLCSKWVDRKRPESVQIPLLPWLCELSMLLNFSKSCLLIWELTAYGVWVSWKRIHKKCFMYR